MVKSIIISSRKKIEKIKDLEKVHVVSVYSETKEQTLFLEDFLKRVLSEKFKKFDYEIFLSGEEAFFGYGVKPLKIDVFLNNEEQIEYVKKQLTRFKNPFITEKIKFKKIKHMNEQVSSYFEENTQKWADEIYRYLTNNFNFKGKVNIDASFCEGELQTFWVIISGKGTNDKIVSLFKSMSEAITLSKNFGFYIKDKYTFIDNYFKS